MATGFILHYWSCNDECEHTLSHQQDELEFFALFQYANTRFELSELG